MPNAQRKVHWTPFINLLLFATYTFLILSCSRPAKEQNQTVNEPYIVVLGTIQDAGSPQAGCKNACCKNLFQKPNLSRKVVSLGLINPISGSSYLFEAGPDFREQLQELNKHSRSENKLPQPDGIFLTHAHIGHYTGLLQLGKEAMNAKKCEVFVLPRMKTFLEGNAPWSQLCHADNILTRLLKADSVQTLAGGFSVTALQVPHRDEFSETAGFLIQGPNKSLLFIPDIDKWDKWALDILGLIKKVDYALMDGTFYSADELKHRKLSEIPHPLVEESMQLFQGLSAQDKNKIYFIHLNHTNPLLDSTSQEYNHVHEQGFHVTKFRQVFPL